MNMKSVFRLPIVLLAALAVLSPPPLSAIDYYYDGSGTVTDATNWWTNTNGTGSNPANFTTAGNTFNVQNGQTATATAAWAVSGTGSGVVILTGGAMTSGLFNHTMTLSMQSGASYNMTNTTYSNTTIGTFDSASTFILGNQSNPRLSGLTYGGLQFNGTSAVSLTANMNVAGNLSVINTGQLRLTSGSNLTHNIDGNFTIASGSSAALTNGAGNMTANIAGGLTNSGTLSKPGAGNASLIFDGTGSSNVTWGTHSGSFNMTVSSSKTIVFTDNFNPGTGTITVAGTLDVGATTLGGSGSLTVNGAGKLQGSGTISNATTVQSGGFIEGGTSSTIGTLSLNSLNLNDGSRADFHLTGNGTNDVINVTGSGLFTMGSTAVLKIFLDYTPTLIDVFDLLDWAGGISGDSNIASHLDFTEDPTPGAGLTWDTSTFNTDGVLRIAAVPEPSRVLLVVVGGTGLLMRRRRCRCRV